LTLQELLNSQVDFNAIVALARRGFDWWLDEVSALLPPAWRARLASGPKVWAEQGSEGVWRFFKDGRPLAEAPGRDTPIGLVLSSRSVLVRETPAPPMPAADVRRMMALDIDRLSPLAPPLIHYDVEIIDRGADGGRRVLLGIVPRAVAKDVWTQARARGLEPVVMAARIDEATDERRFDFLPCVLEAAGLVDRGRARRYAWGAVAALLVINLAVLVGRDIVSVQRLKDLVDGQRPVVNAVEALRRRVEGEYARRRAFVTRAQASEPLRMLNSLTQALPEDTWVERLEWNGQTLHLIGTRGSATDIAAAIRGSGAFTNPRALTAQGPSGSATLRPYDITADARPGGRP